MAGVESILRFINEGRMNICGKELCEIQRLTVLQTISSLLLNCICENDACIYMCVYRHTLFFFFFFIRDTTFLFSPVFKVLVVITALNNEKTLKCKSLGQSQSGYQDIWIFLQFWGGNTERKKSEDDCNIF